MVRFDSYQEAYKWLKESKGNKEERNKMDQNQKWSFRQARIATETIIGEWENYESDTGEKSDLLADHNSLRGYIYKEMQNTYYEEGMQSWGNDIYKRHGYSTKNFVLGAVEYWIEKEGY